MSDNPIRVPHDEVYDPHLEEYVRAILPTMTVKKAGFLSGTAEDSALASTAIGTMYTAGSQGSVLLLTKLRLLAVGSPNWYKTATGSYISAPRFPDHIFFLKDRSGTVDYFAVPGAEQEKSWYGQFPNSPLAVVSGSIVVGLKGSYAGPGSWGASFEGVAARRRVR